MNEKDVLAYDPFAEDYGGNGDRIFRDKIVIVKVPSHCFICNNLTVIGTRVRSRVEIYDGEFHTSIFCHECCKAMERYVSSEGDFSVLQKRYDMFIKPDHLDLRGIGYER